MSNPLSGRLLHLSRFLIAIGVFLLIAVIMGVMADKLVTVFFAMDATSLLSKPAAEFSHKEETALKFYQTMSALSFIVSAWITTKIYNVGFIHFNRLDVKPKWNHLALLPVYLVAMVPLITSILEWNQNWKLPESVAEIFLELEGKSDNLYQVFLSHNTGGSLFFNLFLMALLPAIGEELIFRGILQRVFSDWAENEHIGVILAAILFAVLHFQPFKVVPMIFLAMTLGYMYLYSGSLWVPILFHFLNNATVVLVKYLQDIGLEAPILENDYVFPTLITYLAVVVYVAVHAAHRHTRMKPVPLHD
ncbi:MAG: CPBP family intramembrane metalloprotease [Flavobacteriales bacterium]|nr:CPBP family intramembrane metalloprotease [Flavobacteriales bacterium]